VKINCSACGQVTTIAQKHQFHGGFSNRGFLYCDCCSAILEFDTYNPKYTAIVGDKHPWSLNSEEKQRVEDGLKPCAYGKGGRFRFDALPRCPACNESLPDLLKDEFHYVEIGKVIDADNEDVWF
jgi:hypothetical protein